MEKSVYEIFFSLNIADDTNLQDCLTSQTKDH